MVTSYCYNIIDPNDKPIDKYFQELSDINFDLIIIDELFNPCGYLLINLLRKKFSDKPPPVVVYSSTCKQTRMSMSLNNIPIPYSHVSHMGSMSILTDKLTFWQRVQTLLSYLIGYLGDWIYYYVMQRNLVHRFYPDLTDVSLRSSMAQPVFQFYCIPKFFDLPQPLAPNHFYMGGLQLNFTFDSAENSPDVMEPDLQAKISKNEKGFILVALGHWTDFEYCTAEIRNEFGGALNHAAGLGYLIIWKYAGPKVENAHENVHFANWLPQRQLLAHPKCKLLITHGGCNSVTEAIFNGVPVVVTPLFADQGDAAARIVTKNLGVVVQKSRLGSMDVIKNAILEVLTNETFAINSKKFRKLFVNVENQPSKLTVSQQTIFWTDFLAKYGRSLEKKNFLTIRRFGHHDQNYWFFSFLKYWNIDSILCLIFLPLLILKVFLSFLGF
uniref:UDP-glucuronosyltransferase n=1 Tax=Romanomermis culicivorax TaxID=13658 RepID=A0A915I895_ROMCU